jgi:hypothetical protein
LVAIVGLRRRRPRDSPRTDAVANSSVASRWQWLRYRLGGTVASTDLRGVLGALRRPPPPRVVPFVVLKRTRTRLERSYGHWWVEVDGAESYGWWPRTCPVHLRQLFQGTTGTLNGIASSCRGGGLTRDPHHLDPAEHRFNPTLMVRKSDRLLRADIRAFAHAHEGEWRWSTRPTARNCRSFQLALIEAVGLVEDAQAGAHTPHGCPFLAKCRSVGSPLLRRSAGRGTRYFSAPPPTQ